LQSFSEKFIYVKSFKFQRKQNLNSISLKTTKSDSADIL
jgi:hypothetical protein